MKIYIISVSVGLLVGVIYALLQVRSPAPSAIALIGLLGMLMGEQVVPTVKRMIAGCSVTVGWLRSERDLGTRRSGVGHLCRAADRRRRHQGAPLVGHRFISLSKGAPFSYACWNPVGMDAIDLIVGLGSHGRNP